MIDGLCFLLRAAKRDLERCQQLMAMIRNRIKRTAADQGFNRAAIHQAFIYAAAEIHDGWTHESVAKRGGRIALPGDGAEDLISKVLADPALLSTLAASKKPEGEGSAS